VPLEIPSVIRALEQEEFHALDRKLMRIVFDVHNEFGRFLDEKLYKQEIAARWIESGLGAAEQEVVITARHQSFVKEFRMDLLFNGGLMLEAKAADTIIAAHRAQSLNYLLMAGLHYGKLVNFRPVRVEHEFVSTRLTPGLRKQCEIMDAEWCAISEACGWLRSTLTKLLEDWGAFLEVNLYREAITHLLGGPERVIQPVTVHSGSRVIGEQAVHRLNRHSAFAFTAVTRDQESMRDHQWRFLKHTALEYIQWVNFNHHKIEFTTLKK
jgi:GxxExxY protein